MLWYRRHPAGDGTETQLSANVYRNAGYEMFGVVSGVYQCGATIYSLNSVHPTFNHIYGKISVQIT